MRTNVCFLIMEVAVVVVFLFALFVIIIPVHISSTPMTSKYTRRKWRLPKHAKLIGKNMYDLGRVRRKTDGKMMRAYVKINKVSDQSPATSTTRNVVTCDVPLIFASGNFKWNVMEPFGIDASNPFSLSQQYVVNTIVQNRNQWNAAVSCSTPVGIYDPNIVVNGGDFIPDGRNEHYFADLGSLSTLGVTFLWGTDAPNGGIIEADVAYNTQVQFGDASQQNNVYDFPTVDLHEWGHVYGVDHPTGVTAGCLSSVMAPSLGLNTMKRTLTDNDKAPAFNLYCPPVSSPPPTNGNNKISISVILLVVIMTIIN